MFLLRVGNLSKQIEVRLCAVMDVAIKCMLYSILMQRN
jgi:hypothetical protein